MADEDVFYDTIEDNEWEQRPVQHTSVYELHKAAYYNDTKHLERLLQQMPQEQYTQLDLHGNTALHVAALRGNTAAVELLLASGLPAKTRSNRGWTAFDEACAARAMSAARVLQQRMLADAKLDMKQKRAQLLDSMREMPDYSLQLKWQLGSSVPGLGMLLRRYAPHDTYTIVKVGDRLRVDGSLMGLDTKSVVPEWKRGHFSLIVDGSPEGVAAAAAAAQEAMAAARLAARNKQQQWHHTQQQQQQQQQQPDQQGSSDVAQPDSRGSLSPAPAPVTPPGSTAGATSPAPRPAENADPTTTSRSSSGSLKQQQQQWQPGAQQQQQQQQQQQEFYDPDPAPALVPAGPGGPRLLFLNHTKSSWVDLSADKKALKLEADAEAAELNSELIAAMERDMEKLRLKPRNFKFAAVKGWLGGELTEKVEGWKCAVYEATGKLLAVSTSKARLHLSPDASFEDYLAAEYAADSVSETLIDPLTPSGLDLMSSSSKKERRASRGARSYGAGDRSSHGSTDVLGGSEAEFDGLVWGAAPDGKDGSAMPGKAAPAGKRGGGEGAAGASDGSSGGRVLRARCWMAQDFPMSLAQLLPLLDVIGNANKHMAKVGKFLAKYSKLEMFPVKLQVPLLLTIHALVSFKAFHLLQPGSKNPPPSTDFFTVPSNYKRKLLQEVMDKASKNAFGDMEDGEGDWGLETGAGWSSRQSGPFYGGDEGAEYLDPVDSRAAAAAEPGTDSSGGSGSSNSSRSLPPARGGTCV